MINMDDNRLERGLSIEECKILITEESPHAESQIEEIREVLYDLAKLSLAQYFIKKKE